MPSYYNYLNIEYLKNSERQYQQIMNNIKWHLLEIKQTQLEKQKVVERIIKLNTKKTTKK